jgi:tetratricopeptide (TPR) repeat protein
MLVAMKKVWLIWFSLLLPILASGQKANELAFRNAYYRNERVQARIFFEQLFKEDSTQAIRFAEEAEDLFMHPEGELSTDALRLMVGVYNGAAATDEVRGHEWRIKRINLMLQHPEIYISVTQQALRECFQLSPRLMPLHQLEAFGESVIAAFHIHDLTLDNFLEDWMLIDKTLMERSVTQPAEADDVSALQLRLYAAVRKFAPDCGEVQKKNAVWFHQPTTGSRTIRSTFSLLCLHDCAGPFLLDTVWPRMALVTEDPYWMRLAASQAMNSSNYSLSLQLLDKAIAAEIDPRMKAHDLCVQARIYRDEQKFRNAADALEQAMKYYPEWGQPYLDMAALMVMAAKDCGYTEFDRRAVFWAAIDYCALAKNTDSHLQSEANQRIFEYTQGCPTAEELKARNLNAGDTYPLHCWREWVTTVKRY